MPAGEDITFLDKLVEALVKAGDFNREDQVAPAAILWPDKGSHWKAMLPCLRERLPLLTFGPYKPAERCGPSYWLRCMIARTLPGDTIPESEIPVVYLPGIGTEDLRAGEHCPKEVLPLMELQYRGVLWAQRNGHDWTITAFLSSDAGIGAEVASGDSTREAAERALLKLMNEPIAGLKKQAPLQAAFFDSLLNPDEARNILRWLDGPTEYRKQSNPEEWTAFINQCQTKYGFHPEKDGEITAARLLGQRDGAWTLVWSCFAEASASYPNLPDLLRKARPKELLPLIDHVDSWPQDNEAAEDKLCLGLVGLETMSPAAARTEVKRLEKEHGERRQWVWASLGCSPLAKALGHLSELARATEKTLGGTTITAFAEAYSEWGWKADAEVLSALAAIEKPDDVAAVKSAVGSLYRDWLEASTLAFQKVVLAGDVSKTYPVERLAEWPEGTCLLFSDGLRLDIGHRLAARLEDRGVSCELSWRLSALPGVTSTAKPAVSPVSDLLSAGSELGTIVKGTGTTVTAGVFRKLLADNGFQVLLRDDLGDPSGKAWTELGDIDSYGHEYGWKVASQAEAEIRNLASRVAALLTHGWKQAIIITDHGWLMLPGGLPKATLPEHLTETRKGRCAALKYSAITDEQWVPWYWDPCVRIAIPRGIHCYEAGRECEHGGISPQECVTPVIRAHLPADASEPVRIADLVWRGLRCSMTITGGGPGTLVDIRAKPADPFTSLASQPRTPDATGHVSLLVPDEDKLSQAAHIVILDANGAVRFQMLTTVDG